MAIFNCYVSSPEGKRSHDERAQSLIHTRHACFFLQAHTLVLECVEGAGQDKEVAKGHDLPMKNCDFP